MFLHRHKHATFNANNLKFIRLEQGHDYSLTIIKEDFLYPLMYLRFISYKLKLIDNYNSYVVIDHMIKIIMLHIYSTVELDAINTYFILYHMI